MRKRNYASGNRIFDFLWFVLQKNILSTLTNRLAYYDEPHFFKYSATVNFLKKHSAGSIPKKTITANGFSMYSEKKALIKCLGETLERFSLYSFTKKDITYANKKRFSIHSIRFPQYIENRINNDIEFGWVKGFDVTDNKVVFIPAQLVYLNYLSTVQESLILQANSNGAAGAFSVNEAILSGIYELIERDSFMTTYLNKIAVPEINIKSIRSNELNSAIEKIQKYHLKLRVFDLTTDLCIPCYMTILLDITASGGPSFSIGLKSNLNMKKAMEASIEEAVMGRVWLKTLQANYEPQNIAYDKKPKTIPERAFYWLRPGMVHKLDFWLKQKNKKKYNVGKEYNYKNKLEYVVDILKDKGINISAVNISPSIIKSVGYHVYKVVSLDLQPLYLDETMKIFNYERLNSVKKYFQNETSQINNIPHPFL